MGTRYGLSKLSHPYHLDASIFFVRDIRIFFSFLFHFAASHLGLFCLPMSRKKNAMLKWVNKKTTRNKQVKFIKENLTKAIVSIHSFAHL